MSWLTDLALPKIRDLVRKSDTGENLWRRCDSCGQMIFHRDLEAALQVCPDCGHHMRIGPQARLKALFDDERYETIELPKVKIDPLRFRDRKRYGERLKDAQGKTGQGDAMVVGQGGIEGGNAVCAVLNFDFMGGSMGMAVGEAIVAAAKLAGMARQPLVIFTASGGARMQEGILSLMQMARTTVAITELREAGLPYISVLTNPTTGGVTASFAMLGDIHIAEPGAVIGFAGPRVIEDTIREKLPDGFQRAEYLLEHGMLDMVVPRSQMRPRLATLLRHLTSARRPASARRPDAELLPPVTGPAADGKPVPRPAR